MTIAAGLIYRLRRRLRSFFGLYTPSERAEIERARIFALKDLMAAHALDYCTFAEAESRLRQIHATDNTGKMWSLSHVFPQKSEQK